MGCSIRCTLMLNCKLFLFCFQTNVVCLVSLSRGRKMKKSKFELEILFLATNNDRAGWGGSQCSLVDDMLDHNKSTAKVLVREIVSSTNQPLCQHTQELYWLGFSGISFISYDFLWNSGVLFAKETRSTQEIFELKYQFKYLSLPCTNKVCCDRFFFR